MNNKQWLNANQQYLFSALNEIRADIYRYLEKQDAQLVAGIKETTLNDCRQFALDKLCRVFNLSDFERKLLLLCAAVQLDREFAQLCVQASTDPAQHYVSFDLALQLFNHSQWLPFLSDSSLRYWQLLRLADSRQASTCALYIDEQVLHYLTGYHSTATELSSLLLPLPPSSTLVPSHKKIAGHIQSLLSQTTINGEAALISLTGASNNAKINIVQHALSSNNIALRRVDVCQLPQDAESLQNLFLRFEREALFNHCAYYFEVDSNCESPSVNFRGLVYLLKRLSALSIINCDLSAHSIRREIVSYEVARPVYHEQLMLWQSQLGNVMELKGEQFHLQRILDQFELDEEKIQAIVQQWRLMVGDIGSIDDNDQAYSLLWKLCRKQCRAEVSSLVNVLQPFTNDWQSLVLATEQQATLVNIVEQVRHRHKVYQDWGFANGQSYGDGISALFAGASGTGKTLAARVIAGELDLDIYQIDLSAIVSKYIGETEKNLELIFRAAEKSGAILLFDEADALFGKRSQVQDSKDRYANMEVSYLLQRMESYSGLSILTSNHRTALDAAFTRRLRFIVQFPFPQAQERARIWRSVFPAKAPTQKLDFNKLARLEIPGGTIKSIAVNAAFHGAKDNDLHMQHVLRATREEFAKSEKTLLSTLVTDW